MQSCVHFKFFFIFGRCGGEVASVLAFHSDNPSSNPLKSTIFISKCLKRNEKEAGDCQLKFLNFAGDGLLQHAVVLVTRRVDQLHHRDCRLVPSRRACRGPRKIRKNSFRASALRVHSRRTKGEADGKLNF